MSRVSIVIPCYDVAGYLEDAVASARAQTHDDTEIVVVDDGSTDPETREVIDRLAARPDLVVLRRPHAGTGAARNAGIRAATGDYILPLDADDLIAPDFARLAAGVLDEQPDVGIVGGAIEHIGLSTGRFTSEYDGLTSMLFHNLLFASSVSRRADWERVGGYPEGLAFGEDWIYWLRLLALGREVHLLPDTVWYYRQHEAQMTRSLRTDAASGAVAFAMRDQPELYIRHFDLTVDFFERQLEALEIYRRRYRPIGKAVAVARRVAPWVRPRAGQ